MKHWKYTYHRNSQESWAQINLSTMGQRMNRKRAQKKISKRTQAYKLAR